MFWSRLPFPDVDYHGTQTVIFERTQLSDVTPRPNVFYLKVPRRAGNELRTWLGVQPEKNGSAIFVPTGGWYQDFAELRPGEGYMESSTPYEYGELVCRVSRERNGQLKFVSYNQERGIDSAKMHALIPADLETLYLQTMRGYGLTATPLLVTPEMQPLASSLLGPRSGK